MKGDISKVSFHVTKHGIRRWNDRKKGGEATGLRFLVHVSQSPLFRCAPVPLVESDGCFLRAENSKGRENEQLDKGEAR